MDPEAMHPALANKRAYTHIQTSTKLKMLRFDALIDLSSACQKKNTNTDGQTHEETDTHKLNTSTLMCR